jgi:OPA family glycerol-3-phosphate transporter-like MFS transporter
MGTNWAKATNASFDPKWITVALPVGMALGAFMNGWISDKLFGSKRYPAIVLFMVIGAATSLWMYTLPGQSVIAIVALFLAGFFVFGPASCFWALCPDLVGPKRAGTATGVLNFFSYLFAGIAEPLIGRILDKSGDTSQIFVIVAIACIASAVVAPFIRR